MRVYHRSACMYTIGNYPTNRTWVGVGVGGGHGGRVAWLGP